MQPTWVTARLVLQTNVYTKNCICLLSNGWVSPHGWCSQVNVCIYFDDFTTAWGPTVYGAAYSRVGTAHCLIRQCVVPIREYAVPYTVGFHAVYRLWNSRRQPPLRENLWRLICSLLWKILPIEDAPSQGGCRCEFRSLDWPKLVTNAYSLSTRYISGKCEKRSGGVWDWPTGKKPFNS